MHSSAFDVVDALIDVLPAPRRPEGMKPGMPWMPEKRRDIPGSVWLPDVGRGAINPALDARNRNAAALLMQDKMQLEAAVVQQCLDEMLDGKTGFATDAELNHDGMATMLALRISSFGNVSPSA